MTTTRLVFNTIPPPCVWGFGLIVICIVVAAVLLTVVATRTLCVGVCLVLAH